MANKYIIENLTLKKLSYLFYVIRFNIIFEHINLAEFLNQESTYIEVVSSNNKPLHTLSLYTERGKEQLRVRSGTQLQSSYSFRMSFPLEDLRLCFIDETKDIYLESKKDNNKDLYIPIYFDTYIQDKKLNEQNFLNFIKLLSDYVVLKEDED